MTIDVEEHEDTFEAAPGSIVVVRDEEWLVTKVERASDGWFVSVQGLGELVRDTEAVFSTALDTIEVQDPSLSRVVSDDSPGHRRSRLWLEATLRKTAIPLNDPVLTVATQGLADALPYQLSAVRQALDPDNLRPRILLADAVGLGKTLEIGMILAELVRRGRGERILVVTPRHVLEQMQFELWTRFALPFVRLDSVGIQRIRQKLPANRNPFAFFKRAIISIDTLKSDRYIAHLEKQRWDAVVIDESHNVTNSMSQNNRLARLLSSRTDALILASATPHNGKAESFAELIRMLEPSAVRPDNTLIEDEVRRLIIRRHRHSPEVESVVGADWAERLEPENILVPATPVENEIAHELDDVWLYPESGRSPYAGSSAKLFPWTLAKAFLSSPAALLESVRERAKRLGTTPTPDQRRELDALKRLGSLAEQATTGPSAKYDALLEHLRTIGVSRTGTTRAVVFAERVPTLRWLQEKLRSDLGMKADQVRILHGGLTDVEQQDIVESFKQETSPIRVLVTGDVASEGVNLHLQCHHLIHFDIPWSLIRIEQRNGRIDRYGQKHPPRITTLLLEPTSEKFAGDIRVLQRLMEKEHEAHQALGDSASLMGKFDVKAEEEAIRQVLAEERDLDTVVRSVAAVKESGGIEALLASLMSAPAVAPAASPEAGRTGVYADHLSFLRDALEEVLETPGANPPNGVAWREHPGYGMVEMSPTPDLRQRLEVLPQSYLRDRRVTQHMKLATTLARGKTELSNALGDKLLSSWPEAHFLSTLHPALEWACDRALASLIRNQVFAVHGPVEAPSMLLHGTLTNRRGQMVASSFMIATFPNAANTAFALTKAFSSAYEALLSLGIADGHVNTGGVADVEGLNAYVPPAVKSGHTLLAQVVSSAEQDTQDRIARWSQRMSRWDDDAGALVQRSTVRDRRQQITEETELARQMSPHQRLVRPLLLVVPRSTASEEGTA